MNQSTNQKAGQGLFLSFEGIDGAGKSTHIEALAARLMEQGRQVVLTREPGGTPLAETLRQLILNESMDPLTESLLVFAARRDHLQTVIVPALAAGSVVLCDRFTDATFAYQGAGRGFDLSVLRQLERWVQIQGNELLQPHLTLWFDCPPELAAQRLAKARAADRFESQSLAFFERVVQGYTDRMVEEPRRFVRINAQQDQQSVRQEIFRQLTDRGVLL
jgi:dTMP kinase